MGADFGQINYNPKNFPYLLCYLKKKEGKWEGWADGHKILILKISHISSYFDCHVSLKIKNKCISFIYFVFGAKLPYKYPLYIRPSVRPYVYSNTKIL